MKPTGGTSGLAAGAVSTASCSADFFSVESSASLTESGEDLLENKPRRGFFSSVELIVRWGGKMSRGRRAKHGRVLRGYIVVVVGRAPVSQLRDVIKMEPPPRFTSRPSHMQAKPRPSFRSD